MTVCIVALLLSAVLVALTAWVDSAFFVPALLAFAVAVFSAPYEPGRGGGTDGGSGPVFGGDGGGGDGGGG